LEIERFQLVDKLLAYEPTAGRMRCGGSIPLAAPLFDGHFPGHPLFPGVLQLEFMGQAASLFLMAQRPGRLAILVGVERARFRRMLLPGAAIEAEASLTYESRSLAVFACELHGPEGLSASADIRVALTSAENPATIEHIEAWLHRLNLPARAMVAS